MSVLTQENVIAQLAALCVLILPLLRANGERSAVHPRLGLYDIETSEILAYDADQARFLPLDGSAIRFRWRRPKRAFKSS
jgi:carbonic anhydrase